MSELERMLEVNELSQEIGEFIEWLRGRGIVFAKYGQAELIEANLSTEKLLAEYFKIDLEQAERERRAILEQLRVGVE